MRSHEPLRRRRVTVHPIVVFARKSFVAGSTRAAAAPPCARKKRGERNTFRSASRDSSSAIRRGTVERPRLGCFDLAAAFAACGFGRFRPGCCVTETPATRLGPAAR
jgi:hypothetical protein